MNVIIVCERSGIVRDSFIERGHNAISCDIEDTESPGPHIIADCRSLDYSRFDLMIAHPPCQYLSKAGAGKFWNEHRQEQQQAVDFVKWLYSRPVPHICVENPAGYLSKSWRAPDQYIDPWMFGHKEMKHTGLWLKNLPPLIAVYISPEHIEFVRSRHGTKDRSMSRSRTFSGIARAMSIQWGHFA